jgi:hypothetical protein
MDVDIPAQQQQQSPPQPSPLQRTVHTPKLLTIMSKFVQGIQKNLAHATRAQPNLTALHCKNILQTLFEINTSLRELMLDTTAFSKLDTDTLDALYNQMCSAFSVHYSALNIPPAINHPQLGSLKYTHLQMLVVSVCDHLRTIHASAQRRARIAHCCAADFPFVRRNALAYDANAPIHTYSLCTTMNALFAVYAAVPHMQYNRELEQYTHTLMWRARQFLVIGHSVEMHDVTALRRAESAKVYSWSPQLLYDLTILEKHLLGWFDSASLVDRVDNPSTAHITPELVLSFRRFLRQTASNYGDGDLKVDYIALHLRPGELEFYENETPGDDANVYAAIGAFRPQTYTRLMVKAQDPVRKLLEEMLCLDPKEPSAELLSAQEQSSQLSLAVLSVFIKQLAKHASAIERDFMLIGPGMYNAQSVHQLHSASAKNWPMLVWCCNSLQVWHDKRLHMFNDPIASCITWLMIVYTENENKFNNISLSNMTDEAFYAFENKEQRLARKTKDAKHRAARKLLAQ